MHDCVILQRTWPPKTGAHGPLSHLGGWPNLPAHIPWPSVRFADGTAASLDFLAQIDLASLPDIEARRLLPAEGTLFFFALSQTAQPLEEIGDDAFRVIYFPQAAADVPLRWPPPDTGWGQADLDHGRTDAAEFRPTDGPRGQLHPYCPVEALRLPVAAAEVSAKSSREIAFRYDPAVLPLRVEDALLHINYARNSFYENILPFEAVVDHLQQGARISRRIAARPSRTGVTAPPPEWADYILSRSGSRDFQDRYEGWRLRAVELARELTALGRATTLRPSCRAQVAEIFTDASALHGSASKYGFMVWRPENVARLSLTELLLHDPDLAARHPDEVAAAGPSASSLAHHHKMLGPGRRVQNGVPDDKETLVLLQLESDFWGPRFGWWDGGNLTFWISTSDARARRFDRVKAEIEGH